LSGPSLLHHGLKSLRLFSQRLKTKLHLNYSSGIRAKSLANVSASSAQAGRYRQDGRDDEGI
jgi:hypothetical protein